MDISRALVEGLRFVVYGGLAVAAIRTWRRGRDVAGAWVAATFVLLGAVVIAADRLPLHSDGTWVDLARKLVVAGLLLFPYFLYRFAASFDRRRRLLDAIAHVLTAAVVGVALGVPSFPREGESQPAWLAVFVVAVVVQWTGLSVLAARHLWQAGEGQGAVARVRMRFMALGSIVLDLGLVAVAVGSSAWLEVASQVLGFVAAGFFFLGFDPPGFLRTVWRQPDLVPLRDAEEALMRATAPQDVADVVLPFATRVLGAKGAVLATHEGAVFASYNLDDDEAAALAAVAATGRRDVLAVPLRRLWLAVQSSLHTPFFGTEELDLLRGLAVFGGLALDRVDLFEQERASRERAEQANADLETFVYSVSHDLKSPLVSITGFLDYLRTDLGPVEGDVAFYLDRMEAGVHYMDALIHDLLELSRIGRVNQDPADVDLGRVVREAAEELLPSHSAATVDVGDLPVVHMSPLRARQLFTNLIGNALAHAGRSDVHVSVRAERSTMGTRVVVADDGKGIPPEYRERVFRVFERLERGSQGTGIGLAFCRKIVEHTGGSIRVGDGPTGTTLEIEFPAAIVRGPAASLQGAQ